MNNTTLKYGAIGVGVLLFFVLMRGNSSSSSGGGLASSVSSLANAQATNIQLSQITAARDAVADQQYTARLNIVTDAFIANSAGRDSIALQTINNAAMIAGKSMDISAMIQQSLMATDLAKTLAFSNADVQKYGIDASKYLADVDSKTTIKLGQYEKDINRSDNKTSMFNNTVSTIGKVFGA